MANDSVISDAVIMVMRTVSVGANKRIQYECPWHSPLFFSTSLWSNTPGSLALLIWVIIIIIIIIIGTLFYL